MREYYKAFLKAITEGGLQRQTSFSTGDEAIYRDGCLICGDDIEEPDLTEDIQMEPLLVLFGCGHVGKALYDLAVLQDMKVTVLDCREDFLTAERFPKAERIAGPYEELLSRDYGFTAPYYCIFTHGHRYDDLIDMYALVQSMVDDFDSFRWSDLLLHLNAGAEINLFNIISARAGVNRGFMSVGAGIWLPFAQVDASYGWQEFGVELGDKPVDAVTIKFNLGYDKH